MLSENLNAAPDADFFDAGGLLVGQADVKFVGQLVFFFHSTDALPYVNLSYSAIVAYLG